MDITKDPVSESSKISRRRAISPKAVSISTEELVKESFLEEGSSLPLVITPNAAGLRLSDWAANNREMLLSKLLTYGGILFRGFDVREYSDLQELVVALEIPLMEYYESSTPRKQMGGKIYTSTEFPPDQTIALHNELSAADTFPAKLWFFCHTPAEVGGETPIADVRKVYQRISPETRETFERKGGWLLVRNYGDGFGIPWQTSFHTDRKEDVEAYCREHLIEVEWKDGDRLRTRQIRPAAIKHPVSGEMAWFNHIAFWHTSSLHDEIREVMLKEFAEEDLPYQTYYADGSSIPDEVVAELRAAYEAEKVSFLWQKGDVTMLDNISVAHGRGTYTGERKILVAMGEPYRRTDI